MANKITLNIYKRPYIFCIPCTYGTHIYKKRAKECKYFLYISLALKLSMSFAYVLFKIFMM